MSWFKKAVKGVTGAFGGVTGIVGSLLGGGGGGGDGGAAKARADADVAIARINASRDADREKRKAAEQQYQREHKIVMEKLKAKQEADRKAAELQMQKDKQAHEEKLKKMKMDHEKQDKAQKLQQKNASINVLSSEINKLDIKINNDKEKLGIASTDLARISKMIEKENEWIHKFESYKATQLNILSNKIDLKDAKQKFEHDDNQIKYAIDKTGQHDDNVCKFLKLTHGLIGATLATTSHSNKLSVEVSTFGDLISRECRDKLTIETYFNDQHLERFIPILAKKGFTDLDDLKCNNEDEYNNDILNELKKCVKKQRQIDDKSNKDDDNKDTDIKDNDSDDDDDDDVDPGELAKELLTKWKLVKFFDKMEDDGWDDPNDWKDLKDKHLKDFGFADGHIKKFKRQYKKWAKKNINDDDDDDDPLLNQKELRVLKDICLNPSSWKPYQLENVDAIKEGLLVISPLLGEFFTRIHIGIKQSQEMLAYDISLNNKQLKAINNVQNMKPIEYIKDDDDKDNRDNDNDDDIEPSVSGFNDDIIDPQKDIRGKWAINSSVEIYSDSNKKWYKGTIINIKNDNEGEWLDIKYTTSKQVKTKQIQRGSSSVRPVIVTTDVAVQCRALTAASIVSIDVTDTMLNKFNKSSLTMRALTVARGVEDCCMQIIRSQGTIRGSVLLAQEILKLKPAYKSNEATKLWKAVDDGIIHIFDCALQMVTISAKYFSFFLKFKQSFGFYVSSTQNNPDISLLVSLQHVKKDIRDFTAFQKDFKQTVDRLTKEAMNCIRNCVENQIGAAAFQKFQDSREKTLKIWLDKKKIYDARALEIECELDKHQQERIVLCSEEAKLKYQVDMLTKTMQRNITLKKDSISTKTYFEKMII